MLLSWFNQRLEMSQGISLSPAVVRNRKDLGWVWWSKSNIQAHSKKFIHAWVCTLRLSFQGDSICKIKNPVEIIVNDLKRILFRKILILWISMVIKISKIFSIMKLKYDSVCNNAKKNNKFIRATCTKTILLNSQ